jgi:hypothetical protein
VTFVVAGLGAIFGAFLARRTERFKHLQELRSSAYVDFILGFAKVTRAQNDSMRDKRSMVEEREGMVTLTDSRNRIAIYGGKKVIAALSEFVSRGTETNTKEGMEAFLYLCAAMRAETSGDHVPVQHISDVLFS